MYVVQNDEFEYPQIIYRKFGSNIYYWIILDACQKHAL